MSSHFHQDDDTKKIFKDSEPEENLINSQNVENSKIEAEKIQPEVTGNDGIDVRIPMASESNIHSKQSPSPNIQTPPESPHKLTAISVASLNSYSHPRLLRPTFPVMSTISGNYTYFPLKNTKTPPNSNATSISYMHDIFPVLPPPTRLVLCVGLCNLEIIHICKEFPVERSRQLLTTGYWQRSGNASNNCTVLRNLGAECEFLGVMSSATAFSFLADDCRDRGIIIENCPLVDKYPPFSSILSCTTTGTFTIIHTNLGFPTLTFQNFKDKIQLYKYSWIHFEGRNPKDTKSMINMIRRFNADSSEREVKPIIISLELAKSGTNLLSLAIRANILFVGQDFAMNLGWSTPKDTVYNLRQLLSVMQLREEKDFNEMDICFRSPHIICTWGSKGCSLLTSSYDYYHIDALQIDQIVDAKGSGDVLVATFIYAMNNLEMEPQDALALGCQVAVFKMQHMGLDCIKDYKIFQNSEYRKSATF